MSSNLFKHLVGSQCVLVSQGVFNQADLYSYLDRVFAKRGSSYIRLGADGSTSCPKVVYESLSLIQGHEMVYIKGPILNEALK